MARLTLDELKRRRPTLDHVKIEATTDEDIRRHMIEDREDPDAEIDPAAWIEVLPPREVRLRLGMTQAAFAAALRIPAPNARELGAGAHHTGPRGASPLQDHRARAECGDAGARYQAAQAAVPGRVKRGRLHRS